MRIPKASVRSAGTPPGFVPHPGGMGDNSPMFQHWEQEGRWRSSPEGTAEDSRAVSAVSSGLDDLGTDPPNVETLGYCRMSLRDKVFVDYFKSIFRIESLVPLVLSSVLRAARRLRCWT